MTVYIEKANEVERWGRWTYVGASWEGVLLNCPGCNGLHFLRVKYSVEPDGHVHPAFSCHMCGYTADITLKGYDHAQA